MKLDAKNNIVISGYHVTEDYAEKLIYNNIDWLRKMIKKNSINNKKLHLDEVDNKENVIIFLRNEE